MTEQEWLNGNQLSIDIWNNKYRWNNETLDEWFKRVSSGNPVIERLIKDKKFLFGGSTSMYGIYNAFTQVITDGMKKDPFNIFEKTLLIKDILDL